MCKNHDPETGSLAGVPAGLYRTEGSERQNSIDADLTSSVEDVVRDLARVGIESRAVNTDVVGVEDPRVDPEVVEQLLPAGWEILDESRPVTVVREGSR